MQERTPEEQRWETLEAAVRDAVESRPDEPKARTPRSRTGVQRPTVLLLLLIWTVITWIWATKPAFIFGRPSVVVQSPEVEDATLRFAMFLERSRIDQHVRRTGTLPASLKETGPVEDGVSLIRTSDGYELIGQRGASQLRLTSAMRADSFLGNSMEVLRRAGSVQPGRLAQ